MSKRGHVIKEVEAGSTAQKLGIEAGDSLVTVGGEEPEDVFDYRFMIQEEDVEILFQKASGEEVLLQINKAEDDDLGIQFENGLMDEYRSCHNKCIFCFIDQMPKGMRETLYFKDDDARLSFLQGNYVTLTNMSDKDVLRIVKYHLSPINISFQTMNPELRCKMLNNRFAGEALKKTDIFYEAGIEMNGQIVLCKGVNDGAELEYSIRQLLKYLPYLRSVSVVPVGLSKHREGLPKLEPFTKADAIEVLEVIHRYQKIAYEQHGLHFIHAGDEWYILAGQELPPEQNYDGYLQLENGVGMLRLLLDEFAAELRRRQKVKHTSFVSMVEKLKNITNLKNKKTNIPNTGNILKDQKNKTKQETELSIITGRLAYPYICRMAKQLEELYPGLTLHVYEIRNDFFGEQITVSGLLTGQDITAQLQGKKLGSHLLLPQNVLRSGEAIFLDDMTLPELESTLQVSADIVKSSGRDFVEAVTKYL